VGLESRLTAHGATKPNTPLQPQLTQPWQFLFNTPDTNLSSTKQTLNEADPDLSFHLSERLQWLFTSYVFLGFRRYEILWNLQLDSVNENEKPSYMRARAHTHNAHTYIRKCKHTPHLPHIMPTYLHRISPVQPRSDTLYRTENKVQLTAMRNAIHKIVNYYYFLLMNVYFVVRIRVTFNGNYYINK